MRALACVANSSTTLGGVGAGADPPRGDSVYWTVLLQTFEYGLSMPWAFSAVTTKYHVPFASPVTVCVRVATFEICADWE